MLAATNIYFQNSQILLADGFWRTKMHHHAKLGQKVVEISRFLTIKNDGRRVSMQTQLFYFTYSFT